jgi:hypothetical protein
MYKINECDKYKIKKINSNTEAINTNVKLVEDDLQKLSVLPKYCPMHTKTYSDFFNNESTLKDVEPYKYTVVPHPKGGLQKKMDYNIFYSDMKLESLKSPPLSKNTPEYENISGNTKCSQIPNILIHKYEKDNTFSKHFGNEKPNINPNTKGYPGFDSYNQLSDYNNSALKKVKDLYSAVIEDMYLMSYKPVNTDDISKNINYYINNSGKIKK